MSVKGFKGFKKGLICDPTGEKPFQYKEGETYETENVKMCDEGFHFCENPLDVLRFYPLVDKEGNETEFARVEALGETISEGGKSCTQKIKIGAKISFKDLVDAAVKLSQEEGECSSGEDKSIGSSGNYAIIGSSGEYASIGSAGYDARIGSSGYDASIGSAGDDASIGSSGEYASIGSAGRHAIIGSSGKNSVICCAGNESQVRAKIGSWITLAEWGEVEGEFKPICVKTEYVDGERIKEDVYYRLEGGEFVEVEK